MSDAPLRVALVGCGAIAQAHARALAASRDAVAAVVCDVDRARAEQLRRGLLPSARVVESIADVAAYADAAIVAVPNAHHGRIARQLLAARLHVLCEKPLTVSVDEAEAMLAQAREADRVLACGFVRRHYGSTELVRQILTRRLVGEPRRFVVRESVTNWPMVRASFDRASAGGGVFIDMAPHVLDLLHGWLGAPEILRYEDDARDGVEATARATVRCGDVEGEIVLSRAYGMDNGTRIDCTQGSVAVDPHVHDRVRVIFGGAEPFSGELRVPAGDAFARQLDAFVAAVRGRAAANGAIAAAHVRTVASAYARRSTLPEPWSGPFPDGRGPEARGVSRWRKILVTGAAGMVGSRLVERWAAADRVRQLRCVVRGHRTAARLHRFTPELAEADLRDRAAVIEAARGCDAVVHLAVGERAREETANVVAACRELGIRRLVHMSSAAVHGRRLARNIEQRQEETPLRPTGEPYADSKAAAERLVLAARDLEAHILRPHMVYGPGMRWSGELMQLLPSGRIPILEGFDGDGGTINLIHVDDLVDSIACALGSDRGFHQPMYITDGEPRTWSEYIAAHAALAGVAPPRVQAAAVAERPRDMKAWLRDSLAPIAPILRSQEFRHFFFQSPLMQATAFKAYLKLREHELVQRRLTRLRALPPSPPSPPFDATWVQMQFSEARLSNARARREIGFSPAIGFAEGLRRSHEWFRLLGLAP